jgi:biopolymer transport protein ExbB
MNVIATVGSIAPFVGLLGTVLGIIGAFQGIGAAGSSGIGPIMAGISEALVETAFGLLVAIPAVIAFNYLNARVSAIDTALARSSGELMDELEDHFGRVSVGDGAQIVDQHAA